MSELITQLNNLAYGLLGYAYIIEVAHMSLLLFSCYIQLQNDFS